jgi:hypothetical protein
MDHAQERHRAAVLTEDDRAGEVELDLRLLGDLAQFLRRKRFERRPLREEARDLSYSGVQLDLCSRDERIRQRYWRERVSSSRENYRTCAASRLKRNAWWGATYTRHPRRHSPHSQRTDAS